MVGLVCCEFILHEDVIRRWGTFGFFLFGYLIVHVRARACVWVGRGREGKAISNENMEKGVAEVRTHFSRFSVGRLRGGFSRRFCRIAYGVSNARWTRSQNKTVDVRVVALGILKVV